MSAFEDSSMFLGWYRRARPYFEPVQFMAGFVFGVAALARLTVIFARAVLPVRGSPAARCSPRRVQRRSARLIPVLLLLIYNVLSSGHIFNPVYDFLYHSEYLGYMPPGFEINTSLGIEDIGHIPLNLLIMLGWPPDTSPRPRERQCGCVAARARTARCCSRARSGMSMLLTSPAYLLAVPLVIRHWRKRIVAGATLAVVSRRVRQPHALQPGLGPVRLSLQQRLRARSP